MEHEGRRTVNDKWILDEIVIDLLAVNNFTSRISFQIPLLAVCGITVISVDVCDTAQLLPSNQATWVLRCQQLGNSSTISYRNNGNPISNVVKLISRNQLRSFYPQTIGLTQVFQEQNFMMLDFELRNIDNSPIDVNPTTTAIQVRIELMKTRFT